MFISLTFDGFFDYPSSFSLFSFGNSLVQCSARSAVLHQAAAAAAAAATAAAAAADSGTLLIRRSLKI